MRILLLNIRQGGGPRTQALLNWFASANSDVLVLPEWRDNTCGKTITDTLEAQGYSLASAAFAIGRYNGILIAAKGRCQSRRVTPTAAEKGELVLADIAPGIRLMAGYFPQGKAKAPFFEICIKEAISSQGTPLLFLGDVNTGHNEVDIEGLAFHLLGLNYSPL